jgi:hypothetical protein
LALLDSAIDSTFADSAVFYTFAGDYMIAYKGLNSCSNLPYKDFVSILRYQYALTAIDDIFATPIRPGLHNRSMDFTVLICEEDGSIVVSPLSNLHRVFVDEKRAIMPLEGLLSAFANSKGIQKSQRVCVDRYTNVDVFGESAVSEMKEGAISTDTTFQNVIDVAGADDSNSFVGTTGINKQLVDIGTKMQDFLSRSV